MTTDATLLTRLFGSGAEVWEQLAETHPQFVAAYTEYARASTRRQALPDDKRELLHLAAESTLTTLDPRAMEDRMRTALAAGATPDELLHVLMLVSFCSVHTLSSGLPAVLDGLDPGFTEAEGDRAERGRKLRAAQHGEHWYWAAFDAQFPRFHDQLARLAPDLFEAYHRLGQSMWTDSGLAPKWCELVFVAMDLSTTHLYLDGARLHVANAVRYGATVDEVVATVAVAAAQGAKTIEVGAPILWRILGETRS